MLSGSCLPRGFSPGQAQADSSRGVTSAEHGNFVLFSQTLDLALPHDDDPCLGLLAWLGEPGWCAQWFA